MKAGARVKEFRKLNEMSQEQYAAHIKEKTGLNVSSSTVGRWERDQRHVPTKVLAYMDTGEVEDEQPPTEAAPLPGGPEDAPPREPGAADDPSRPQPGGGGAGIKPLSMTSQAYEKACIDLWDMIGFGVMVAGRGIGSPVVHQDGVIIQAQKVELGKAYGKLAEQNDTFRRLIIGMTQGGVWVEVVGVTVQLGMALAANHAQYQQAVAQERADAAAGNGQRVDQAA